MVSSRTVLDLEDSLRTKNRGLGLGLGLGLVVDVWPLVTECAMCNEFLVFV